MYWSVQKIINEPCSEGAGFVLWGPTREYSLKRYEKWVEDLGALGAASGHCPARKLLAKGDPFF